MLNPTWDYMTQNNTKYKKILLAVDKQNHSCKSQTFSLVLLHLTPITNRADPALQHQHDVLFPNEMLRNAEIFQLEMCRRTHHFLCNRRGAHSHLRALT